tara:strand:+ start:667 stop:876 length:210 start_codon:yes stop_codon:yes gene_type:complete
VAQALLLMINLVTETLRSEDTMSILRREIVHRLCAEPQKKSQTEEIFSSMVSQPEIEICGKKKGAMIDR